MPIRLYPLAASNNPIRTVISPQHAKVFSEQAIVIEMTTVRFGENREDYR